MDLSKLDTILKMELDGEIYYSVKEAEQLLGINLDDADYIEIIITEQGEKKKNRFTRKNSFEKFVDDRELSTFNKMLKQASKFNPNKDKK
ncbi:hypothetical protein [Flavobacterium sp. N1994]|uniref:hypothetical protein n=1 Tax=Flavobacterium sp. N1994 TaxID=2986827 RepID=UPI00222193D7|nr:hypothetical protein [Flavobacterium sp. N1994]